MNVQNLFETLEALESLDKEIGLQTKLQAINANLESLVPSLQVHSIRLLS
jgi:hypothetical protein